jgi:uncharacterized membrane protein
MKLKNTWFDFTSIVLFLFMLGCAYIPIADYIRGKDHNLLSVVLGSIFFLLLALFFFRMSLVLGKFQESAKQGKKLFDKDTTDINPQ